MGLNKWPSDGIVAQLQSLKRGDELLVYWRDACGFRDIPFPEDVYLTRKATRGAFYCLVDDHLIVISEETHGIQAYEGTCIPIGCIEAIEVLRSGRRRGKKTPRREGAGYPIKILHEVVKVSEPHGQG